MFTHNAIAGPSRPRTLPRKPKQPFVSADERPESHDGVFRVVLVSSGSVASVKVPEIVGALTKVGLVLLVRVRLIIRTAESTCK